jgi:hypothetical protein
MITIRVVDHVLGRTFTRQVENAQVATALLVSLFARPEMDPWSAVYPIDGEEPADIGVTCETSVMANGDALVIVQRLRPELVAGDAVEGVEPS